MCCVWVLARMLPGAGLQLSWGLAPVHTFSWGMKALLFPLLGEGNVASLQIILWGFSSSCATGLRVQTCPV